MNNNKDARANYIHHLAMMARLPTAESRCRLVQGLLNHRIATAVKEDDITVRNQLLFDAVALLCGDWDREKSQRFNPFDIGAIWDGLARLPPALTNLPVTEALRQEIVRAEEETPQTIAAFKEKFAKTIFEEEADLRDWFDKYLPALILQQTPGAPLGEEEWQQVEDVFDWMLSRFYEPADSSLREGLWDIARRYVENWHFDGKTIV